MSHSRRTARRTESGLSLLELFIVMSLLAIFFGIVQESVTIGLRTANSADEREDVREQLTHALDLLTREASVADNVDNAEDQRLQFDADLDGDGDTENNTNYRVQGGDLQRVDSAGVAVTIADDLDTLDFNYVDSTGAAMTTPVPNQPTRDTIRVVQVTITAERDGETISVATAAYLRNNRP